MFYVVNETAVACFEALTPTLRCVPSLFRCSRRTYARCVIDSDVRRHDALPNWQCSVSVDVIVSLTYEENHDVHCGLGFDAVCV
jgi:hypothetical protein